MASPLLETLTPEIQAQIMRNIDSVQTLISLLRASPRLYQVFRTRRDYFLTQLAFRQFHPDIHDDVWRLAKALQLPQPATIEDVHMKINNFMFMDNDYEQPSPPVPAATIIALCKIGRTIGWFVEHYRQSSLKLLTDLGTHMDLQQDTEKLQSDLFVVEKGRLQRAFVLFQTFCCLFGTPKRDKEDKENREYYRQASRYLRIYEPEDVEELACIRDYLVRHLWGIFEAIEEQAMQAGPEDAIHKLANECRPCWFSNNAKTSHLSYIDHIMSLGLPFLREVLESDGLKRAELVMSNSYPRQYFISYAVSDMAEKSMYDIPLDYDAGNYEGEGDYIGDEVDTLSQGLLWANHGKIPSDFGRWPLKGLRDWGYIFWHKSRLQASGVLDQK
ncbi:MAG: hypothetical protein Q9178_005428 [Gyalolechia marmorata]